MKRLFMAAVLVGCAPGGGGGSQDCQPGEIGECACLSTGTRGEWICNETGKFGACSCEPDAGAVTPDAGGRLDAGPEADGGEPDAGIADMGTDAAPGDQGPGCEPACGDRVCGADGCGGECGRCAPGRVCTADGACAEPPPDCGNGRCEPGLGEDCATCAADCGACCGDGVCTAGHAEACDTCPADCGCGADERCTAGQCVEVCVPDCAGAACGDDGCGGTCGACGGGAVCQGGRCVEPSITLEYADVPLAQNDALEITARFQGDPGPGRVEDVHGRAIADFAPVQAGVARARVDWAALSAVEPLDGGRRVRRALWAVFGAARVPLTARVLCPATQLCLGVCQPQNVACDRSCVPACRAGSVCVDRQCVPEAQGTALQALTPREVGLRRGERAARGTHGDGFTVQLVAPAPAGGLAVRLESLDPAVRVPAEVRVPAGASEVDVPVEGLALTHGAGIIARLGAQAVYGEVRVLPPPVQAPRLVINEIDYNQPGVDTAEFIELFNPTAQAQPVDRMTLELGNGEDDGDAYQTLSLDGQPPVPPGGFLLVANQALLVGADGVVLPDDSFQKGPSDGVRLLDDGVVIDAVAYDGFLLGTTEGGTLEAALRNDREEAHARCPDGADGNDNASDFLRVLPTPGVANASCP
ncbi:MAG: lamin tail domain-containing protein [Myxococcales bacterium]|nr:lamin tail domain-containing protein [Myxococcales bacterium]